MALILCSFQRSMYFQFKMNADVCSCRVFLSRGVQIVSPFYQRRRNNLNEPLDRFLFLGGC